MRVVDATWEELTPRQRVGIRGGGTGHGRRGRPTRAEEIEAGIRCECGRLVDGHPPLPAPLPWSHGRPCEREPRVSIWTLNETPPSPGARARTASLDTRQKVHIGPHGWPADLALSLVGQRFTVELVDDDEFPEPDTVGQTFVSRQKIEISRDLPPDQSRDTLLHETLHALLRIVGTRLEEDHDGEEQIVSTLAPLLLAALRANPQLVSLLPEP